MTVLNTANKVYLGTQAASKVYAGATLVWPPPVSGGLPLDNFTNTPMGVWTMDLERAAYAGPCLRVRNDTTGVETDIGFSGGVLNNAAMATALGTDGGTASVWYNQVAGGPNLIPQAGLLASDRPRPFDDATTPRLQYGHSPVIPYLGSGSYQSALSFAAINASTQRFLKISPFTTGSTTKWMLTFVMEMNGSTTYGIFTQFDLGSGDLSAGGARMAAGNGTIILADQAGEAGGAGGHTGTVTPGWHTITTYTDGTKIGAYLDGVAGTSSACTTTIGPSGSFVVGGGERTSEPWYGGAVKAVIFWNTYSDSDRLLAEAWLRSKYGTP